MSLRISPRRILDTSVRMMPGEELFIFYGDKLWFEDHANGAATTATTDSSMHEHMDDPAAFLGALQL